MPERKKGEPLNEFIGRYVSSPEAEKHFPDKKRRLAVAYAEARKKAKRK